MGGHCDTSFGSEASTQALSECSSRSSLTEDLGETSSVGDQDGYDFHREFRDPVSTPTGFSLPYLFPSSTFDRGGVRSQPFSYLPGVLQRQSSQSRSVSFSSTEEIFGCDNDDEIDKKDRHHGDVLFPKTPVHQFYASKRSYRSNLGPERSACPPLATKPHGKAYQRQPQRSALKKDDTRSINVATGLTSPLEYPLSPKMLWYGK